MKPRLLALAALAALLVAVAACREATPPANSAEAKAFHDDEMKWRQTRHDKLLREDSWLSLVALDWLHEGANAVELPSMPPVTVHVMLTGAKATLGPDPALTVDGKPVAAPVELKDDGDPHPTVVHAGSLSFLFIKRADKNGDRYGLRVKDPNSEPRKNFKGLDYFDADSKYRVEAHFEPYTPRKKIAITNVLAMVSDETAPGGLV